ncbi:unnamed protein product, partial [Mesorhabditis belari]|uniref:Beta-Casp domain-containing protein n=1 Tax=Mesorhabditis belari TaxID=2138241 RepID=A0AAF3F1B0_9BILA
MASNSAQLTNLSWVPYRPCWLLRWPNVTIMMDCAIDYSSMSHFLPQCYGENTRLKQLNDYFDDVKCFKSMTVNDREFVFIDSTPEVHTVPMNTVQMDCVDAILISNPQSLVALPFYCENTNFKGEIYATSPTIQFGRLLSEELIEYFERLANEPSTENWKKLNLKKVLPPPISRRQVAPLEWRRFYSLQDLEAALKRITVIAFQEKVTVLGVVNVTAYGNGFAIGSCNWLINNELEKVGYMSATSSRTSHTRPVDWVGLRGADRLVLTSLATAYDPPEKLLTSLLTTVIETLRAGGNVLMPIFPTGIIFDFIDLISTHIDNHGISHDVPIYFISPVAKKTLAFSNINSEWLIETKQENVWKAEEPFYHAALLKNGRLKVYDSLYGSFSQEYRSPCVCFAGHPSLRIGDAAHLLEMWGKSKKNAVILTEPDFLPAEVWPPFSDLAIRVLNFPIDTRIDLVQLNQTILSDLKPKSLCIPSFYNKRTETGAQIIGFSPYASISYEETVSLGGRTTKRKRVKIHPELIKYLEVAGNEKSQRGVGYGQLRGFLNAFDNTFEIMPAKSNQTLRPRYSGKLDVELLKAALDERQITYTCEQDDGNHVITTEKPSTVITIYKDGLRTNVEAVVDEERNRIVDVLGSCLKPIP